MRIAEGVVPKAYWEPIFERISMCFENGQYEKKRGVPVYTMTKDKSKLWVAATSLKNKIEVHGWLMLDKPSRWECWEVTQSYVFSGSRGLGWGELLYDTVITKEGIILASGCSQSKSSRGLWKKMIKTDRYHIWAHDFHDTTRYEPVIYDEDSDDIWSALKIYNKDRGDTWKPIKEDIRLIAIRKPK